MIVGKHYIVDLKRCSEEKLKDKNFLQSLFIKTAKEIKATVISISFNEFFPHGVSGVLIIAESHLTVHSFPELNYASVDLYSCELEMDLDKAVEILKNELEAEDVEIIKMYRGTKTKIIKE